MKRSYTMAQQAYPAQYQRALNIRASKRQKIDNALPVVTDMAVQAKIRKSIKRDKRRNADQRATYSGQSGNAVDFTGNVNSLLVNLTLGDGSIDHFSGESIMPTEVTVNWAWDTSAANGLAGFEITRIMLFQWRGSSAPTQSSAYLIGQGTITAPLGNLNWDNFRNYTLLADSGPISFSHGAAANATNALPNLNGNIMTGTLKAYGSKLRKVFFNSSGDVEKNDIMLVTTTTHTNTAIATAPEITFNAMVRYLDEA